MRTGHLIFSGILACACAFGARGQLLDQADAPDRVPPSYEERFPSKIVFERDRHDFGTVLDNDGRMEAQFTFMNEGTGILRIENTTGSCSCTVPTLTKRQYLPGESGTIRVVYDPKNRSGDQHQTVTVVTNDPDRRTVQLIVTARVRPSIFIPRTVNLGQVQKDRLTETALHVGGRLPDFRVVEAYTDNPEIFEVTIGETEPFLFDGEPEPLPRTELTVRLLPGAPIGLLRTHHIRLRTNDPQHEFVQVEVVAHHLGDIEMLPERVSFGAIRIGERFEQEVVVRSRTGTPFTILDVEDRNPDPNAVKISVAPNPPVGNNSKPMSYTIRMSGQIPENGRSVRGMLLIHTDVDREQTLNLPYFATARRN